MHKVAIRVINLSEGVSHLEDLPIDQFLDKVSNLERFVASEKLDGANLWFGIDNEGDFYTSREGKSSTADRKFHSRDWPDVTSSNAFRGAHKALSQAKKLIEKYIKPGMAVEVEVIKGSPKSTISFLRGVKGDSGKVVSDANLDKLADMLSGMSISVRSEEFDTPDGQQLVKSYTTQTWTFDRPKKLEVKAGKVRAMVADLEHFLKEPNEAAPRFTNRQAATINLGKVDQAERPKLKAERERLNDFLTKEYKLPIRNALLRGIQPQLSTKHSEGAVFRDPKTNDQVKIINKDVWTAIHDFNYKIRDELDGAVKTDDPTASEELRGGLFGETKIRIAKLLGVPELAKVGASRILRDFKGKTPEETAQNFAAGLADLNFEDLKNKLIAVIKNTQDELATKLADFKANYPTYKLELKDGEKVGYSPNTVKRTMLAFAELKQELDTIMDRLKKSKTTADLVVTLYSHQLDHLHESLIADVEHLLVEGHNPALSALKRLTDDDISKTYMATLLAAQLLLRAKDQRAAKLLRDPSHMGLRSLSSSASPLNFWGTMVFYPNHCVKWLDPTIIKPLTKQGKRFILERIRRIHMTLSSSTNLIQDWDLQEQNARLVALRLELNEPAVKQAITGIRYFETIRIDDKSQTIAKVFSLLQRWAPQSPLLELVRDLANKTLQLTTSDDNIDNVDIEQAVKESLLKLIAEDDVASTGATLAAMGNDMGDANDPSGLAPKAGGATKAGAIASTERKFFRGKLIQRKPRNFKRKPKFPRGQNDLLKDITK